MKKLLMFIVLMSFISSCDKKSNNPPKTKTQLLTQATWKFSLATVGGTDVSALLQACQKDNLITFVSTGTGTLDEGATKCNGADPQTRPITWSWQTNETILQVSPVLFAGGSTDYNLQTLSETQLIVSQMITVGGTPQNAVVTFIH